MDIFLDTETKTIQKVYKRNRKRKQKKKLETKTIQKELKSKYIKENKYNKIKRKQQKK